MSVPLEKTDGEAPLVAPIELAVERTLALASRGELSAETIARIAIDHYRAASDTNSPAFKVQYRAKVVDGTDSDVGNAQVDRIVAEMDLEDLLPAVPAWQEGYIERRFVTEWRREP